jgi:hypothetical protein
MKESTLIDLQKKVEKQDIVIKQIIEELLHLRDLSVGSFELVKQLDDYGPALKRLADKTNKEREKLEKEDKKKLVN